MLLSKIAEKIGISTDAGDLEITAVNSLDKAVEGEITFLTDISFSSKLSTTSASAVIVPADFSSVDIDAVLLPVDNIDDAMEKLLLLFAPQLPAPKILRHPNAVIDPNAILGDNVSVGPGAVIEQGVEIGVGTVIGAGCIIASNVKIGNNCLLWPNVVINHCCVLGNGVEIHANSTIGTMGFGYRTEDGQHKRIPHIGNVVIEDNVEIGANSCVDRAKIGSTVIGAGTKIDNLVQIAHNVQIGPNCIIVSQAGIAGSTELGKYVVLAGQAGLADHCIIEDFAQVGPRAATMKGQIVPSGAKVLGAPAQDANEVMRQIAMVKKLPELVRDFKKLSRNMK